MNSKYDLIYEIFSQGCPLEEGKDFSVEEKVRFLDFLDSLELLDVLDWDDGASKLVLIPRAKNIDYVIKIPYSGIWAPVWEETNGGRYEMKFSQFLYAGGENRIWDYCDAEAYRYKLAEEAGLGQYFAKTEFFGFVNGYPIYIQQKCETFENASPKVYSYEEKTTTFESSNLSSRYRINLDWLTDFRFCYGEEALLLFTSFITDNNWDDDLREANIGYLNNKPVLIDYSGFLE